MLRAKTEMCLCELSDSLEEPEYKLSRHLKVLKTSGILGFHRDGKWIYHSLVSSKPLKLIHDAIRSYADTERQFDKDFRRFRRRLKLREGGRCRQPPKAHDQAAL